MPIEGKKPSTIIYLGTTQNSSMFYPVRITKTLILTACMITLSQISPGFYMSAIQVL